MNGQCVLYEADSAVALLRLNRPEVLNAMNRQLWIDLEAALALAGSDPIVKAVVITGEGRAFSTGADLKESKTRGIDDYRRYLDGVQAISRRVVRFEKPTIAAVNGYALGSGCELALACDIRLAAEGARIGFPEARVSSSVTGGTLRLLQDLVGAARARELLFTAEAIDAAEAAKIGLVNRCVPDERLMAEARNLAGAIAANSAFSIRMIKKGLRMAQGEASLETLMDFEVEACLACVSTSERQDSLKRFEHRERGKDQMV